MSQEHNLHQVAIHSSYTPIQPLQQLFTHKETTEMLMHDEASQAFLIFHKSFPN